MKTVFVWEYNAASVIVEQAAFSKDGVSYPLYVIILSIVVGVLKTIFEK